ncbi:MAG TPA: hypothetical protein VLG91_15430, partial [Streptomyces sp.]|nr:hypothetical protein [Streptomyces sp.]
PPPQALAELLRAELAPPQASPAQEALILLDGLYRHLEAVSPDDPDRRRLDERLRQVLETWRQPDGVPTDPDHDLDTASDDDLFAMVDDGVRLP